VVTRIDFGLREGLNGSSAICSQAGQQDRTLALGVSNVDPIRTGEGTSFERYTALPFNGTYNSEVGRITAATANSWTNYTTAANKVIECRGYSAPATDASNFVGVVAGTDNYNNPAPVVTASTVTVSRRRLRVSWRTASTTLARRRSNRTSVVRLRPSRTT